MVIASMAFLTSGWLKYFSSHFHINNAMHAGCADGGDAAGA